MVDWTLGDRVDLVDALRGVDFESIFEGTQFEPGEAGVAGSIGGSLGSILGRGLGTVIGYVLGTMLLSASSDDGDEEGSE